MPIKVKLGLKPPDSITRPFFLLHRNFRLKYIMKNDKSCEWVFYHMDCAQGSRCTWFFFLKFFGSLGVVYTMDHESVPRPCKICDWLLNLSWYHFSLHRGKNVRVPIKFEVPKRHILRPTLSNDMVQWVCSGRG